MRLIILFLLLLESQTFATCFFGFRCPQQPKFHASPLQFPKDYTTHDDYRLEWMYYTGNLIGADKKPYGFQLTLFRLGIFPFHSTQSYMAHMAVTAPGIGDTGFFFGSRVKMGSNQMAFNAQPFTAGFKDTRTIFFSSEGGTTGKAGSKYLLEGNTIDQDSKLPLRVHVHVKDMKGTVLQGDLGYSRKGDEACSSSYYFSQPRLEVEKDASNFLAIGNDIIPIESGSVWMDHEFSTPSLENTNASWDWFNVRLDNNMELMAFYLRDKKTREIKIASGAIFDASGKSISLGPDDFSIETTGYPWLSRKTSVRYPTAWKLYVHKGNISLALDVNALIPNQELSFDLAPSWIYIKYWEGATTVTGTFNGKDVKGVGYTELFAYPVYNGETPEEVPTAATPLLKGFEPSI